MSTVTNTCRLAFRLGLRLASWRLRSGTCFWISYLSTVSVAANSKSFDDCWEGCHGLASSNPCGR